MISTPFKSAFLPGLCIIGSTDGIFTVHQWISVDVRQKGGEKKVS